MSTPVLRSSLALAAMLGVLLPALGAKRGLICERSES